MFKLILHFILVVVVLVSAKTTNPPKPVLRPEDSLVFGIQDALIRSNGTARLAAKNIIEGHGYPCEEHEVQTEDGYLLTMHRIPYGQNNTNSSSDRPAVFLQHGLLSSSADFVVTGPEQAFAFILADAGYDVWMGNARGNTFSRKHISLSPESSEFWDFSWHQIAIYDLPAMIDYVTQTTGQPKIHYAGHSQGTTSFFILMSLRPEYNDKIRLAHMMAPVAYMSNVMSPFVRALSPFVDQLEWAANLFGVDEFLPNSEIMTRGGYYTCRDESPFQEVCANVLFLIGGYNSEQLNRTMLPAILENIPAGAATDQLLHYAQEVNSGEFREWDFGLLENLQRYGNVNPPEYPVERITCPLALHYGNNDWLAAVQDVERLAPRLNSSIGQFLVPEFAHFDFLWAIDAKTLLYDNIMSLMEGY